MTRGLTGNRVVDSDVLEILSEQLDWERLAGKSVLVTGASGMLASYMVYTLLALNDTLFKSGAKLKLYALVRNKPRALEKFAAFLSRDDFELIVRDIAAFTDFDRKLDVIIHAASQASPKYYGADPVGTLKANTIGTMNLLETAARCQCGTFVFISSGEVYGVLDGSVPIVPEEDTGRVDCADVRSCYAESKRMGETMCACYAHQYGFTASALRLAHTYGPGCALDDGRVFADFVNDVLQGKNIALHSDGSARRSFLYVTDMIKALFYILFYGEARAYNVSSGTDISIWELAETLCALYPERNLRVEFAGPKTEAGYLRSKSSAGRLDNAKLRALGWTESVSVQEGFRRMIESYRS